MKCVIDYPWTCNWLLTYLDAHGLFFFPSCNQLYVMIIDYHGTIYSLDALSLSSFCATPSLSNLENSLPSLQNPPFPRPLPPFQIFSSKSTSTVHSILLITSNPLLNPSAFLYPYHCWAWSLDEEISRSPLPSSSSFAF